MASIKQVNLYIKLFISLNFATLFVATVTLLQFLHFWILNRHITSCITNTFEALYLYLSSFCYKIYLIIPKSRCSIECHVILLFSSYRYLSEIDRHFPIPFILTIRPDYYILTPLVDDPIQLASLMNCLLCAEDVALIASKHKMTGLLQFCK